MLRMPEFQVHLPTSIDEALQLRATLPESLWIAGGTDLLPNLKHRLQTPEHLISLSKLPGLNAIEVREDGGVSVGANVTLHTLATSDWLRANIPGLAEAAGLVAGPQHRRMGTIGGNVMLDTRCLFYNQTHEWRTALGNCLKASGDWCHVIGSPKSCVAAQSSDSVPMLIALDARLHFHTHGEAPTVVPIRELYTKDGRFDRVHSVSRTSLLTAIDIPAPPAGHRSTYRKVRSRASIDYPQLGVAICLAVEGGVIADIEVVVGAMLPQPKRLRKLDEVVGQPLNAETIAHLAERGYKQVRPQANIHGSPDWRRHMAKVELQRGLESLA